MKCDELRAVGDDSVRPLDRVLYQSTVCRIAEASLDVCSNDALSGVVCHHIFFLMPDEAIFVSNLIQETTGEVMSHCEKNEGQIHRG